MAATAQCEDILLPLGPDSSNAEGDPQMPSAAGLSTEDLCDIWSWNATVPEASDTPVHVLIGETMKVQPHQTAICAWDGDWTYQELDALSTQLAHYLITLGTAREVLPLCFEKSKWMPVTMLAVMKAGAASLLLDPSQPEERLRAAVEQVSPSVMLCSANSVGLAGRLCTGTVIVVDGSHETVSAATLPTVSHSDPLYLLFTSGTTGKPKGLLITHGNFSSAIRHQSDFMYSSTSRVFDFASYAFDVAWSDFLFALVGGACLCIPSEKERTNDLAQCISRFKITHLDLTPSTMRLLSDEILRGVQTVNVGGEQLMVRDAQHWRGLTALRNMFGPSECTPTTTMVNIEADTPGGSIGKGVGVCTWIVDARGELSPVGSVGELLLEGPLVGAGYLNAETTAAAFVDDPDWLLRGGPNHPGRHGRLYKTGDLVRYHTDGSLIFVGRKDLRVKINGQLAELAEIEHAVRSALPAVTGVVADVVTPNNYLKPLLMAFLEIGKVASPKEEVQWPIFGLDDQLDKKLPAYMIPSIYVPLATFPVTVTGKTDRQSMRAIIEQRTYSQLRALSYTQVDHQQSTSDSERRLQTLWSSVLQIDPESISTDDSFLRIGGDSIGAMHLVAQAREHGLHLNISDIMRYPRLRDMAKMACSPYQLAPGHPAEPFSLLRSSPDSDSIRLQVASLCKVPVKQVQDVFPCTPLQEGLLALTAQREGDYVARHVFELQGSVNICRFQEAWAEVVANTPILRTRIVDLSGQGLVQTVLDEQVPWLINKEGKKNTEHVQADDEQLEKQQGVLGTNLVRFELETDQDARRFFAWTIHHSLFDGRSIPLILRDVHRAYAGEPWKVAPAFQDFVKHVLSVDQMQATIFWARQLRDLEAPNFPALPSPKYVPQVRASVTRQILDLHWPQTDVTPSNTIRAAWALVVSHYTNSRDIVFGAMSAGCQAAVPEIESMTGPTIATVPVRVRLDDLMSIDEFLQEVQAQAVEMTAFEQVGLQHIRRISGDAERACQFQSLLVVQPKDQLPSVEGGLLFCRIIDEVDKESVMGSFYTYAMTLTCQLDTDRLDLRIDFDPKVMEAAQVLRIAGHMEHILQQLSASEKADTTLSVLGRVSDSDLRDIWGWNAVVPEECCVLIHERIAETVHTQPESLAVDAWDGEWTYVELDTLSTCLARHLLSFGIEYRNMLVPLFFEKSKWTSIAMLAVMKVGGASVALEPSQPTERLRTIIGQVQPAIVLTSPTHHDLASHLARCQVVVVNESNMAELTQAEIIGHGEMSVPNISPSSILYCVFTSGSTGTPKGVLVSHSNFSSAILHQYGWYGYDASSRVYDFASYAFDAAWLNVLATFCGGGCLCIPQDIDRINDLAGSMNRLRATHVDLTPSVARLLPLDTLQQLDTLVVSGEALEPADARRWAALVDLKNVYGPCECTPTATIATIPADTHYEGSLIGGGVGVCTWVVDGDSLVPIGGVGELLLEGPLVGMGYLRDADRSAAVFIQDPPWLLRGAPDHPGRHGRIYRTGDLVRYNMDGSLMFIGRTDTRVKINGQLVELAEVEHHIREYEHVRQCACLIPQSGPYAKRLVGAFSLHGISRENADKSTMQALPDSGDSLVNLHVDSIRHVLDRALPPYMVPAVWIALRDIPLSTSGKLDRSELHNWLCSTNVRSYQNPIEAEQVPSRSTKRNDVESVLLDACSNVLDISVERLDCQRSFIGNGGDSISAMRLVPRCRAANIMISVASLLQERSLTDLATLVVKQAIVLSRAEEFDKLFSLSPIQRWYFAQLHADEVRKPECYYNQSFCLRLRRRVCPSEVSKAVTKVVELHSMLRARFSCNEGIWMQHILSPSASLHSLQLVQVHTGADVATLAAERHRQIDIETGPVFLADLSEQPDGVQYLSLIAHHLVVDLVSWRIILDDLETVLTGGSLQTCLSFQTWNELQIERMAAPAMKSPEDLLSTDGTNNDLEFWKFTPSTPNMQSDHQTQFMEVDAETTDLLLGGANRAFHTEPVDLFLSAIWAAFFPVFYERQGLTIWNEGHGREPWNTELDLSRTVGWFTTISPIHVVSSTATELAGLARAIKDARKRLPAHGWTYFTSRYLSQPGSDTCKAHGPPVEIEFNYHGQFQQLDREESLFDHVALDNVEDEGPQIPAPYLFGIEVSIQDKRVHIAVSWNRHIAHQGRIQTWVDRIPASLQALCAELASRQPSKTLCDYPFLNLGYARLDELQQCLLPHIEAINNSKIVEVLPCSPIVTGMLLSQSKQPQLYKTCEIFELTTGDGKLPSATSLAAEWQQVIAHQPSLRSVFTPGLDHKAAFNQVILGSFHGEVAQFDCDDEATAREQFATLPPLECQHLKPPHRLTLCRVGRDGSRIICQIEMSHAITDATSSDLLIHDWSCACDGTLPALDLLATCREVARTFTTGAENTLGFWQQKLGGTLPTYFPRLNAGNVEEEPSDEIYSVSLGFPGALLQALEQVTHRLSVTSVSVLQAAWAITLASYCGTDSVCFGYLASGRDLPVEGLDRCVGAYANMMVCRVNNTRTTSYRDLVQTVHGQMVQDLSFQHCYLAAIQHALKIPLGQALFNSSLNCQRVDRKSRKSDKGQRFSFRSIDGKDPTEYDVAARVAFGDNFAEIGLETRLPFMSRKQAQRVLSLYLSTVAAFTDDILS